MTTMSIEAFPKDGQITDLARQKTAFVGWRYGGRRYQLIAQDFREAYHNFHP